MKRRAFRDNLLLYRRLLVEARPHWPQLVSYLLISLLATPVALLAPLPLKIAVDSVLGDHPLPRAVVWLIPDLGPGSTGALLLIVGLVVLFALLTLIQQLLSAMLRTHVGEKLVLAFRSRLFRHVQNLSLKYHDSKGTSDSVFRIQYDAPAIQSIAVDSLVPLVSALVMLAAMLFVTARISVRLALVALAISPFLVLITAAFSGRLRERWRQVKKLESSAQSVVQETLGAVRVVKAFGREEHEQVRFVNQARTGFSARLRVAFYENCYAMLVGLTTAVGTAAVLYIGVKDVQQNVLTLGELLLVMAYLGKLYEPLKTLGKQVASKQKSLASAERAFALLDEPVEVQERPDAKPLARASGAVEFDRVTFEYANDHSSSPVLEDVSFAVTPGAWVGIIGRTGVGKTTMMNLLIRLYDPASGRITLDGRDLREYRLADLRSQFGIVLQDPLLFSCSIAENIQYGRLGATTEEVIAAAKAADAHDFITSLPDGYQTLVGERGMRLSGGERQRISLARAFLKDAPILILDEPTSSVDSGTEASIIEAMERLMRGRTTFMIAHRTGTLDRCDLVLRVKDRRVEVVDRTVNHQLPATATVPVA